MSDNIRAIDNDDYIDDGTVYDIVQEKEDVSAILAKEFNFQALNRKYELLAKEKEIILQACVEKEKDNPNIEVIKKALSIIAQYESDYTKLKKISKKTKEEEPTKELNYSAVENEQDVLIKVTLIAFILGPLGLLRASWALGLALFMFSLMALYTLPELLASVPFISATLAWTVIKNKKKRELYYHDKDYVKDPVFLVGDKKSPFKTYNLFLKKPKKVWLAALLGFVFGGFGLFYVSWTFALAMLMVMIVMLISLPILLVSVPVLSLALAIFSAVETNRSEPFPFHA